MNPAGRTPWGFHLYPYAVAASFPLGMWLNNLAEEPGAGQVAATFALALGLTAAADLVLRVGAAPFFVAQNLAPSHGVAGEKGGCPPPRPQVRRCDAACRSLLLALTAVAGLSYGHVFALLAPLRPQHRFFLPVWLAAMAAAGTAVWLARRTRPTRALARLLAVASLFFLAVELGSAFPALKAQFAPQAPASAAETDEDQGRSRPGVDPASPSASDRPDIYYIILDGYARADVLQRVHGFDNREFLDALGARGFYVAGAARSNYAQTRLSLPSSLGMCYLPAVRPGDAYEVHHQEVRALRKHSRVVARLKQLGYRYRFVGSVFFPVDAEADEELFPRGRDGGYLRAFLATTILEPFLRRLDLLDPAANRIAVDEFQWTAIARPKPEAGPMFVFAHVVCPHGPYLYDRHGPRRDPVWEEGGTSQDYVEQVRYVNGRVLELLDAIGRTSGPGAVVVLQADHGSQVLGMPPEPSQEQLFERMSILSAYRVPERARQKLYPAITPVNSFRAIFAGLFGDDLPLLPDHSYYSSYEAPLEFVEAQ